MGNETDEYIFLLEEALETTKVSAQLENSRRIDMITNFKGALYGWNIKHLFLICVVDKENGYHTCIEGYLTIKNNTGIPLMPLKVMMLLPESRTYHLPADRQVQYGNYLYRLTGKQE